jgi:3-oxoacyl-[acyl-carrier-protein] synthase-1
MSLFLGALGIVNSLGSGKEPVREAVMRGDQAGIRVHGYPAGDFHVARTTAPASTLTIRPPYVNRVNSLLAAACDQILPEVEETVRRYGRDQVAVLVGSTDNGSEETTAALIHRTRSGRFPDGYSLLQMQAHLPALFVADYLGLTNIAAAASTACSSSASAITIARNLIEMGLCRAAVVGGADIVSESVLYGFHALEAVDRGRCNPFSRNRRGINLGEGAALFVLGPEPVDGQEIRLLGSGETSDAYHMTAPAPGGEGAQRAMRRALADAALAPGDVDYVNLHGTGTVLNDSMESKAMHAVFPEGVACSSTKALAGHTLGAAGAMELGFCWLALTAANAGRQLPPHVWDGELDPALPALDLVPAQRRAARLQICMSNSFAFGGCNVSLVIGRS